MDIKIHPVYIMDEDNDFIRSFNFSLSVSCGDLRTQIIIRDVYLTARQTWIEFMEKIKIGEDAEIQCPNSHQDIILFEFSDPVLCIYNEKDESIDTALILKENKLKFVEQFNKVLNNPYTIKCWTELQSK